MNVLLVSTYELGRQPLNVASPAAALRRAGHDVRALDLAVDDWDDELIAWAGAVAFSVPMHTAMRMAVAGAERIRAGRPELPIAVYGLYAAVSHEHLVGTVVDRALAGEYEAGLVEWAGELDTGGPGTGPETVVEVRGRDLGVPDRTVLPPLARYARLQIGDELRLAGAVETTHGCSQRCRHCPVPAVYGGRTTAVDLDVVMADVAQLVGAGARHVTFADADFLSRPTHAMRAVRAVAAGFPELTFDVTTKVEHVLRHEAIWAEVAAAGCLFVVSAVECLDDRILAMLDKGHTAAEAARAVELLRSHGIDPHPSFLPFTPWTTLGGFTDILDFVARHDLVPVVDPVQYSLRLLIPEGSLLLDVPELGPFLDHYDDAALTWRWRAADPAVDELQARLAALVQESAAAGEPAEVAFVRVGEVAGHRPAEAPAPAGGSAEGRPRPRLTEAWFCCAEPTEGQLGSVRT